MHMDCLPKLRVEIVVYDDTVDKVLNAMLSTARKGRWVTARYLSAMCAMLCEYAPANMVTWLFRQPRSAQAQKI